MKVTKEDLAALAKFYGGNPTIAAHYDYSPELGTVKRTITLSVWDGANHTFICDSGKIKEAILSAREDNGTNLINGPHGLKYKRTKWQKYIYERDDLIRELFGEKKPASKLNTGGL